MSDNTDENWGDVMQEYDGMNAEIDKTPQQVAAEEELAGRLYTVQFYDSDPYKLYSEYHAHLEGIRRIKEALVTHRTSIADVIGKGKTR